MLHSYPGFQTREADVARAITFEKFRGTYFDAGSKAPFIAKAHWAGANSYRLTNAYSNSPTEIRYEPETVVRQYIPVRAAEGLNFTVNGKTLDLSDSTPPLIIQAGRSFSAKALGAHQLLALRVESEALRTLISALLDDDIADCPVFEDQPRTDSRPQIHMKQAALQFVADLELIGSPASKPVLEGLGQVLLLKFVFLNAHNLSFRLRRPDKSISASQGRLIEEYIEANWDKTLNVEEIVRQINLSARSVFRHLKRSRGVSPFEFQKEIRLMRARARLQTSRSGESVAAIAIGCGFISLGHFSRDYRKKFGELPSATLRYSRASSPHRGKLSP